jgi:hypothetical protein
MTGRAGPAVVRLAQARVFFAHQSVGANIVEGIKVLQNEQGSAVLNVIDMSAAENAPSGFFAHARLGVNGDPKGKTDAFVSALEGGLGGRLDVAFQKYCFADIDERTDVPALFENYRQAMIRLHHEFPHLRIVHMTTPLVQAQGGPKAVVKKIIGRAPDHYEANMARERFNALLRQEYQGREPLFDLSSLEASDPSGTLEPLHFRGATVLQLRPEYTSDGAHLNSDTAKRVAAALLVTLSEVIRGETVVRSSPLSP